MNFEGESWPSMRCGWRDWLIFMLAVIGWAGFVGTVLGQLSINDQMGRARSRAEEAEAKLEKVLEQNDEIFHESQRLCKQQDLLIENLRQEIARLDLRLKKYEP